MAEKLISGDNHIDLTYLPPDLWSSEAPNKWKLLAPRTEELDDGLHWFVEAQDKGMWNGVGPGFLKYQQGSFHHVDEMLAAPGLRSWCDGIYNDWVADFAKRADPNRVFPLAIIHNHDPKVAAA